MRCACRPSRICHGSCNLFHTYIRNSRARYLAKARSQELEGYVTLRFTVTKNGAVMNPIVIQSEPIGIFESALLDSMHKWQYWPVVDCERVDTKGVESTISFMVEQ